MSDWRPDFSGFSVTKGWFPRDWGNLLDWPPLEGRPVIADSSARVLAAQNGVTYARQCPDLFPDIDALVARFRYATSEELFALVSKDPSIVWLSSGSSLTGPELCRPQYSTILESARQHAIVSCSCFNAGYAGISLFESAARRRLVVFYGGRIVERPPGV
jgi:hypothetical protein